MATGKSNKLLGLLIIVAIIVVVAAIVIPMQRSKGMRDNLLGALDAASGAKLAVAEASVVKGTAPSNLVAGDIQWDPGKIDNPYVARIDIGDGGLVTVVTRNTGAKPDPTLVLTPAPAASSGALEWHCTVEQGNPSILSERCPAKPSQPAAAVSAATATSSTRP